MGKRERAVVREFFVKVGHSGTFWDISLVIVKLGGGHASARLSENFS